MPKHNQIRILKSAWCDGCQAEKLYQFPFALLITSGDRESGGETVEAVIMEWP